MHLLASQTLHIAKKIRFTFITPLLMKTHASGEGEQATVVLYNDIIYIISVPVTALSMVLAIKH